MVGAALATSTLESLERADLHKSAARLKQQMLDQPHLTDEKGVLLPMVELALLEIRAIARTNRLTIPDKEVQIEWTLIIAGF